jgi:putative ABC transport system permease protein
MRNRAFSAVAIATLALGIGGVSLVFSITAGLLADAIPYQRANEICILQPSLSDWRLFELMGSDPGPFASVAAYNERAANLADATGAERILVGRVTPTFLSLTGTRTAVGRGFSKDDFQPRQPTVLLLTDAFWRRRFGASLRAVGQTLTLDDRAYTIIGVIAPPFRAPEDLPSARSLAARIGADVLLPLTGNPQARDPASTDRMWRGVDVLVRLRPGANVDQGRSHLGTLARQLSGRLGPGLGHTLVRLPDYVAGDLPRQLALLGAAVTLLLVVAGTNVAHLLLARGLARRQEMAIRSALGAARRHLMQCSLTDALLLSLCGGVLGVCFAWAGEASVVGLAGEWLSRTDRVRVDGRVLAFTALVSLLAGLGVGLVPGLHVSRIDPLPLLNGGMGSRGQMKQGWLRTLLVVTQIALSLTLLIGGGLLAKDFLRATWLDLGFDPAGVLVGELSLSRVAYAEPEQGNAFFRKVLDRTMAIPGVQAAALTNSAPGGPSMASVNIRVRRNDVAEETPEADEQCEVVAGAYFATLAIPMRAGRPLDERDRRTAEPVVVTNEQFARKYWGGTGFAINQQVLVGERGYRVVGVAGNVQDLEAPAQPRIYFAYEQFAAWSPQMTLLLRVTEGPKTLAAPLTRTVAELNRLQPIYDVRPLKEIVVGPLARRAVLAALIAVFGLVTIIVACVGVYGATSCAVAERRREIAIRLALGASVSRVVATIALRGGMAVLCGLVLGIGVALSLTSLMRAHLVGVTHTDVGTYAVVTLLVAVVGLGGSVAPVVKVVRGQPLAALHSD